jgi:hypothetical protein
MNLNDILYLGWPVKRIVPRRALKIRAINSIACAFTGDDYPANTEWMIKSQDGNTPFWSAILLVDGEEATYPTPSILLNESQMTTDDFEIIDSFKLYESKLPTLRNGSMVINVRS